MLIPVCGLPGVGKTTVAELVADATGAVHLRTDVVRKELLADPTYTDEEILMVYGATIDRARRHLASGESVVLDATFLRRETREMAVAVAERVGVDHQVVRVTADTETVRSRIEDREGESDAEFETYLAFERQWDPLELPHVTVDNAGDLAATREQVARHF